MSLLVSLDSCRYVCVYGGSGLKVFARLSGMLLQQFKTCIEGFLLNFNQNGLSFLGVFSYGEYVSQVYTCFMIYKRTWRFL